MGVEVPDLNSEENLRKAFPAIVNETPRLQPPIILSPTFATNPEGLNSYTTQLFCIKAEVDFLYQERGRLSYYEDLKVIKANAKQTLYGLTRGYIDGQNGAVDTEITLPHELQEPYEANKKWWENPAAWNATAIDGYYGHESIIVTPPKELLNAYNTWYYNQPNAVDSLGLLSYARSKGLDTSGYSPLSAIKAQLRAENNGKRIKSIENADFVQRKRIGLSSIVIPNMRHYENVEARELQLPPAPNPNGRFRPGEEPPLFSGVLVERDGRYILADGYHRLKWARENGKRMGHFIVLSTTEYQDEKNNKKPWRERKQEQTLPAYEQEPKI